MRYRVLPQHLLSVALAATLATGIVIGQQQPAPAPTTPNAPSPGSGTPGNVPTRPTIPGTQPGQQRPQDQQQFPEMQRPVFLSGKVMMEDGTPPPESVMIERMCNGVVRPEGQTDSKGRFSFELGRNAGMFMDASVSSPDFGAPGSGASRQMGMPTAQIRERDLMGCELRATLPGFRSEVVNLSGRRFLDNPDVGVIVLRRMGNVEGLTISATSFAASKDAKKAYEKGRDSLKKNKLDDAQKSLEKAVELHPKYAVAWYELGMLQTRRNDAASARKAFSEAMAADQKYISPYEGMAQLAAGENNWQEVADITDRMIKLNPVDFPRAYFLNSVAKLNLRKLDGAEKSATALLEMDKQHRFAKAEHVMGLILAQKEDYAGAATHIRKFLELAPAGTDVDTAKKQLDQLEKAVSARAQENK